MFSSDKKRFSQSIPDKVKKHITNISEMGRALPAFNSYITKNGIMR
jgi:hypothetical protein